MGAASAFSSNGPTRDNRLKPDIVAPGERIISALSADRAPPALSQLSPDRKHRNARGTSMSAPQVAGALAVLLALDPSLDSVGARALLTGSARADDFTGAVPNPMYGAGRLDLYAAVGDMYRLVDDVSVAEEGGVSWLPEAHSSAYNIYRGLLPAALPFDSGVCLAAEVGSPAYNDADIPSFDSAYFYLVTGVRGGIEGSAGPDGSGVMRLLTHPCH
jgi:subtilisin family serine protease